MRRNHSGAALAGLRRRRSGGRHQRRSASVLAREIGRAARGLKRQVYRGLHHRCELPLDNITARCARCSEPAEGITSRFLVALPELRASLATDVEAAYDGDPAATGTDEVIFCYPGLYAITCYRMANRLLREGASIIPRMITEHAHEKTGIDIHPGATIGRSFFIDHGTGIVIGGTAIMGERVRIYQGVTLGALSVPKGKARDAESKKRHPTIEDDVIIYANATISGGRDGDRARRGDRRQLLGHHVGRAGRAHCGRRMRHPGEQRANLGNRNPQDSHEPLSQAATPACL